MTVRRLAVAAAVAAVAATVALHQPAARPAPGTAGASLLHRTLPRVAEPAFSVPPTTPLTAARHETRWAPVLKSTVARATPRAGGRQVARVARMTPEGTANLVLALARVRDHDQRIWVRVRIPALPHRGTAWVRRSALGAYRVVATELVVDRRRLTATLRRDGRVVFRAPVGIGAAGTPTPAGRFYVRDAVTRYRSPMYGPIAFGTSARSPTLTDWPGGGFVGVHGTDRPDLIPGRVSHGCIRLRNPDIVRLSRLMPVGTPLTIR
jgi:lipoprotein-anchoring transpeptidase ErfK/SrfK